MNEVKKSDEMREEYDFSGAIKGKYHDAYQSGSNAILLEPDIAARFKDSESENHALRMLISHARKEAERNITK